MSEILTGPDRGPPKFDWRDKAVKLQAEVDRLTSVLSNERARAQDAVVRGMKLAEALGRIADVATGKDFTLNDNQAVNKMGALAEDALTQYR